MSVSSSLPFSDITLALIDNLSSSHRTYFHLLLVVEFNTRTYVRTYTYTIDSEPYAPQLQTPTPLIGSNYSNCRILEKI